MKILIPTEPDDGHAVLVKLCLEETGHHVRLLFTADLPTKQRNSVYIDASRYDLRSCNSYESIVENEYDVVWWRRPRKPYVLKQGIHPEDYRFVVRENTSFFHSIMDNIASKAWWINPKSAATRANSKLVQLKTALECKLTIPVTLCSNDPDEILSFVIKHQEDGVIYKPQSPGVWFENKSMRLSYTTKISELNLPPDHLLQQVPGIYQKEIPKAFELRVVYLGGYIIAVKLHSQAHSLGLIDWRAIPEGEMKVELYLLPEKIEYKIRKFMHSMGLIFGSLDLIVTPEGDFVFLEVNEQGQFLWLETYNSGIKILDVFIQFLLSQSQHFTWNENKLKHSIDDFHNEANAIIAENVSRHVCLNNSNPIAVES